MLFGILPPEVVPLRVGIRGVCERDAKNLLHKVAVSESNPAQLSPVFALAAIDDIVDGRKRVFLMVQVPMQHGCSSSAMSIIQRRTIETQPQTDFRGSLRALPAATNHNLRSGIDRGAGSRCLFADGAISFDLDFEAGGGGLLDNFAHRQADERWNAQPLG
jgi:hypothetical protein